MQKGGTTLLMRALLSLLAPGGANGRLSVLIFHRVHAVRDPLFPGEPDATDFERQMRWVQNWFNVLPLEEAVAMLITGKLPPRAMAITFDDGYADNLTVAAPVLRQLGLPATFFVATGFMDGGVMWNDSVIEAVRQCDRPTLDLGKLGLGSHPNRTIDEKRVAISALLGRLKYLAQPHRAEQVAALVDALKVVVPTNLMLTSVQLKELAREGMTIGAHTVSHPILKQISLQEARREIAQGREWLESVVGEPVRLFAYPNGKPERDYDESHVGVARELGFAAAFSTSGGAAKTGSDIFQIPRFTPWDRAPLRYGLRLAKNLTQQPRAGT